LAERTIGGDGLFRFGTAAGAGLRQLRGGGNQLRDEIGTRTRMSAKTIVISGGNSNRNQSVAQARLLSRNGTLDLSRPRRRKGRAGGFAVRKRFFRPGFTELFKVCGYGRT
jgi:hypothetical protein